MIGVVTLRAHQPQLCQGAFGPAAGWGGARQLGLPEP